MKRQSQKNVLAVVANQHLRKILSDVMLEDVSYQVVTSTVEFGHWTKKYGVPDLYIMDYHDISPNEINEYRMLAREHLEAMEKVPTIIFDTSAEAEEFAAIFKYTFISPNWEDKRSMRRTIARLLKLET